ncbi:hypothetical protein N9230_01425 [Akkermansiaceae bacterium]|nr:hypothetical protein [Akkermansiaceae bacterium]
MTTFAIADNASFSTFLVALLALVGIIVSVPITHWIGRVLGDYLAGTPSEKFTGQLPMMGMASTHAMRGELNEAVALYEAFLLKNPREMEIYVRLAEIAYGPFRDQVYGDKVLERAKKNLPRPQFRAVADLSIAIVNKELFPLKHLGWCDDEVKKKARPEVEIPEQLKGQFSKNTPVTTGGTVVSS